MGIGEVMTDALIREFREDTGLDVLCRKLLWSEECFWTYHSRKVHSISFYYLIELSDDCKIPEDGRCVSQKDNCNVILEWMPICELSAVTIYPAFISKEIHHLDGEMKHFITRD